MWQLLSILEACLLEHFPLKVGQALQRQAPLSPVSSACLPLTSPSQCAWHGAAVGTEVHTSSPHAVASRDSSPLSALRLAALMGNDLFIPKAGSQASEGKPLRGK